MTDPTVHELVLDRILDVPRAEVWRAWTTPELLVQWWCPKPWQTTLAELDVRAGGTFRTIMQGPAGESFDNSGLYLEVVPEQRIVFTDAFTQTWVPSGKAFMVADVTFEDLGDGRTRYIARCRHWSAEDCAEHERMGFHEGWGAAADQLVALMQRV